jgi:hypothetical protein
MASTNVQLTELLAEEKFVEIWPDYPCLYDVRSAEFKDRDRRQQAMEEIAEKINQNGWFLEHQNTENSQTTIIFLSLLLYVSLK